MPNPDGNDPTLPVSNTVDKDEERFSFENASRSVILDNAASIGHGVCLRLPAPCLLRCVHASRANARSSPTLVKFDKMKVQTSVCSPFDYAFAANESVA